MGELVKAIAQALVDNPEQVAVNEVEGSQSIIIELRVSPDDMGKVIGKQGRNCQSNPYCCKSCSNEGKQTRCRRNFTINHELTNL